MKFQFGSLKFNLNLSFFPNLTTASICIKQLGRTIRTPSYSSMTCKIGMKNLNPSFPNPLPTTMCHHVSIPRLDWSHLSNSWYQRCVRPDRGLRPAASTVSSTDGSRWKSARSSCRCLQRRHNTPHPQNWTLRFCVSPHGWDRGFSNLSRPLDFIRLRSAPSQQAFQGLRSVRRLERIVASPRVNRQDFYSGVIWKKQLTCNCADWRLLIWRSKSGCSDAHVVYDSYGRMADNGGHTALARWSSWCCATNMGNLQCKKPKCLAQWPVLLERVISSPSQLFALAVAKARCQICQAWNLHKTWYKE